MTQNRDISDELIEKNLKLVPFTINKYFKHSISSNDYEDLVSVGNIGLIKAARAFDKDTNTSFSYFAIKCIYTEILCWFRIMNAEKRMSNKNTISLNDTPSNGEIDNITYEDLIPAKETSVGALYDLEKAYDVLKDRLTDNQLKILNLYLYGYSQQQIADKLKVSNKYINKILHEVVVTKLKDLRREI